MELLINLRKNIILTKSINLSFLFGKNVILFIIGDDNEDCNWLRP